MSQAAIFSVKTVGPESPSAMAARIDDNFKAALSAHSGASRPSYAVAGTVWVSTATAGKLKFYAFDGADDNLFQTLDIATGKVTYSDGTSDDAITAALNATAFIESMKWRSRGIGELYTVNTAITGVDTPPSTTTDTVWIELTSGLTGVGGFNNGKLTSESISGSAPLVLASAVINFTGSPINGQTVQLLNTEGRIIRPSTSPGTLQNDQMQGHFHSLTPPTSPSDYNTGGSAGSGTARTSAAQVVGAPTTDGTNGTPRTGLETRMKNIGVKAYMRIK